MEPICSVLEKHYVATGALAAAALQASRQPAPRATFCLQLSPISGVVTYLPFCIYKELDRKISQMHPIIKKAAVRAGGKGTTRSPHYAECLTPQLLYTSSASSRCCGSKQGFLPSHCMCMYYGSSTNQ